MKKFSLAVFLFIFLMSSRTVFAHDASLTLSPAEGKYREGQEFEVKVLLDTTDHETVGADVSLTFDTKSLELVYITPGNLYATYPPSEIDNVNGTALVSGIVKPQETYQGNGVFVTLRFLAIHPGNAPVTIEHEMNNRNDSNIASTGDGEDVLDQVTSAEYQIVGKGFFDKVIDFFSGLFGKKK